VADRVDGDPVRTEWRAAVRRQDCKAGERVAASGNLASLSAARRLLLGEMLCKGGANAAGIRLLRQVRQANPADFWANELLYLALSAQGGSVDDLIRVPGPQRTRR
jgi:hypothetical protein